MSDIARAVSAEARLQAMLDVEACLAEAEASVGVIPQSAVNPIRAARQFPTSFITFLRAIAPFPLLTMNAVATPYLCSRCVSSG